MRRGSTTTPAAGVLYLNLTYRCNSRCVFCAADVEYQPRDEGVPLEQIRRTLGDKRFRRIDLSGGEPTIHPEILDVVRICREHADRVVLLTHGRRLRDPEFTRKLLDQGANVFVIPLYGPNRLTHDYVSAVNGSFDETVKGFEVLQAAGSSYEFVVELKLLLTKYTAPLNRAIYRLAKDRFPDAFHQVSVCPLIYSRTTMRAGAQFSCDFSEVKDEFFALIEEIQEDCIYTLRADEFPPCFFPERLLPLAHPHLALPRAATPLSYADPLQSPETASENTQQFQSVGCGNSLVHTCRRCRHDTYCSAISTPFFSAKYLSEFGEREFRPSAG